MYVHTELGVESRVTQKLLPNLLEELYQLLLIQEITLVTLGEGERDATLEEGERDATLGEGK